MSRPFAFLVRRLANGGMERVLLDQARAAAELAPVRVLCLEDPGPLAGAYREAGVPVEALGLPAGPLGAGLRLPALRTALARIAPRAVQTHQRRTGFLGRLAARSLGVPTLVALHNEDPPCPLPLRPLERLLDASTRFLAVSEAVRRSASRTRDLAPRQVAVAPNALPHRAPPPRRARDRAHVGFLGKLEAKKAPDRFLDAVAPLVRSRRIRATLAGAGPMAPALRAPAAAAGVELLGELEDGAAYLGALDLAVFPSRREGFGLAVGEALAAGVPVLLADIPAFREVYGDLPPETFFPAGSPVADLTDRILRVLDGDSLGRAQAESAPAILARYSAARAAGRYRELYAAVIRAPRAPTW